MCWCVGLVGLVVDRIVDASHHPPQRRHNRFGGGLLVLRAPPNRPPLVLGGVLGWCVFGIGPLVPVSSNPYRSSTSGLSTPWSVGGLVHPTRWGAWRPHLEDGFPLRCFQRLPVPNVANQPCPWRDNWHTRGSSVPVLSYWGQAFSSLLRAQRIGTELSHDVLNPARVPL